MASLTDHLARMGISHVYCSPFLQADPAAGHGYAVVDPGKVDTAFGGEEGRRRLVDAARDEGMGIVIDLVPNHMAVSLPHNRWFWEVLEHGPSSRFAGHFDVDWDPPESPTRNKVLLPILGDHYGREVESGTIRLRHDAGRFSVVYHDNELPASPRSIAMVLGAAAAEAGSDELAFLGRAHASLPSAAATDETSRRRRHADAAVLGRLVAATAARPEASKAIDTAVERISTTPDELDAFLDLQNYRLTRWQASRQELGYRRFFDIDTRIGVRVEDPSVFADSHDLALSWVHEGEVDGLRIDHPDGLRRPGEYLERLRGQAPSAWIVVEKILEGDEALPESWPVDGTTGYEFTNDVTRLFIDPEAEAAFTALWEEMSGSALTWEEVVDESKRFVLRDVLAGDLNRLAAVFGDLTERRRLYRDFTRAEMTEALTEALVAFDVYRTYVTEDGVCSTEDRRRIDAALERAADAAPDLDPDLFALLGEILRGELDGTGETALRMRFQQLSGPVMAKGVEDTAFYRYLRLAALCEVGGDPGWFGLADIGEFHDRRVRTQQRWPTTMLALSTHDTKRSEDVRARLAVLSEIPAEWAQAVRRWRARTEPYRSPLLDGGTEYLIYQTLVGAHPIGLDRLLPYLEKATKEAKAHTSWTDPDPSYDEAVADFARHIDADEVLLGDIARFVADIAPAGHVVSLAQRTLQLTAPGVPDVYQGTEIWDLSLVDPDNRRIVDHDLRRRLLDELDGVTGPEDVLARTSEGLPKLWLLRRLLELRHRLADAFGPDGDYEPVLATGPASDHVVAHVRGGRVAVVVPRLSTVMERSGGWRATTVDLPDGRWKNVFDDVAHTGTVEVDALMERFPVAVLERSSGET